MGVPLCGVVELSWCGLLGDLRRVIQFLLGLEEKG
jgi:hypothetical protein